MEWKIFDRKKKRKRKRIVSCIVDDFTSQGHLLMERYFMSYILCRITLRIQMADKETCIIHLPFIKQVFIELLIVKG